jgi:hypothetical protein
LISQSRGLGDVYKRQIWAEALAGKPAAPTTLNMSAQAWRLQP